MRLYNSWALHIVGIVMNGSAVPRKKRKGSGGVSMASIVKRAVRNRALAHAER
jgi:hypothetical protein